jgi:vitamin B12 transporter
MRRPEHQASAAVGGSQGRVRWNVDARWTGEREDRFFPPFPLDPEPVTLPSHTVVNLGLDVAVFSPSPGRPGLELLLRGENLADETYEEALGFPAPGRGVYVGGRISWQD